MIKLEISSVLASLNPYCRHALEEASSLCISQKGAEVTINHFLFKILENPYSDIRTLLSSMNIDHEQVQNLIRESFVSNNELIGEFPSFSPLMIEVFQEAALLGNLELKQKQIRSGTVFLCVLLNAGRYLPLDAINFLSNINREALRNNFNSLLVNSGENDKEDVNKEISFSNAAATDGETPLDKYAINFTAQAEQGKIDPVLSRDDEIDLMIDILLRRRKNNPIAVGDAGVGKSALVEGLALRISQGRVPDSLKNVQLWGVDLGALQSGASVKGEFEKRLKSLIDQVKHSSTPVILFIDEAHTLIGAGAQAGGSDAANLLKPALARGELRTIAATTWSEYKKYFEKDPALSRRFQLVKLDEPTVEQATNILRGLRSIYETSHKVYITEEALQSAAEMSSRYVSGRQLPDKAIDILDTACARVATGLQMPPKKLSSLDNKIHEIKLELENLHRDYSIHGTEDNERVEYLQNLVTDFQIEAQSLEEAWSKQKQLVEEIIEKRNLLLQEESHLRENEEIDQPIQLQEDEIRTIKQDLQQLKQALMNLQEEQPLLHAEVGKGQIAAVISDLTGIPASTLTGDELERITQLPVALKVEIKGQDLAIEKVHQHLLTATADLKRPGTPLGTFLLVGPSGVGKTETAIQIAENMFGGKQFLTTINMSEYQEKHSISRLIGSPPGYVGYGEGGILTEAMRQKPYSIVLLDEVEKAHPEILNLFYQAFDKGEVADGEGRIIDCKNILFFLTSNIGFDYETSDLNSPDMEGLKSQLLQFFKPALLARMQIIPYNYLDSEVLEQIVYSKLDKLVRLFKDRYKANLEVQDSVIEYLKDKCVMTANGARMLDSIIDGEVLPPLSLAVLEKMGESKSFSGALLSLEDGLFNANIH